MKSWPLKAWWFLVVVTFVGGWAGGFVYGSGAYRLPFGPWVPEFFLLLVSGALGGLAQALLLGTNRLHIPRWTSGDDGRTEWDAGFVADVFVGMVGSVASLMFALALLNDKLFGAVGGTATDTAVLIPPWARVVAFGVLAGFAARQLLPNLSDRMKALIATEVKEKGRELDETNRQRANANANRTEVATALAEVARMAAVVGSPAPPIAQAALAVPPGGGVAGLQPLLDDYAAINIADPRARVAARKSASELIQVVVARENLTSDVLAQQATAAAGTKEWVLPLATLIAIRPGDGDAARLFNAYDQRLNTTAVRNDSKFILYRVLLAIVSLQNARQLPPTELGRARAVAAACREIDDEPLRRLASAVLALLG